MSKTIGLLYCSGVDFTLTNGACAFDSSNSVSGGFSRYFARNVFKSACCAGDKDSPVTGSFRNDGDVNWLRANTIVKVSVPGFLSSVRMPSPFGKMNSTPLLTLLLVTPLLGKGLLLRNGVGALVSPPGPKT